jgi:tRNA(Ile)-lysidine synthase
VTSPDRPSGSVTDESDADDLIARLLLRCRFPEAAREVVCGVSGGADSSALVVLAAAQGLEIEVVHVDHGLRPGGDAEAAFVESIAQRFGCAFRSERVDIADGPDLEERCRRARRAVLGPAALTGHTLDDHAETVLWHLLRGSGLSGVSGIDDTTHPLVALRRADTEAVCGAVGIDPLTDPTNRSPRFTRNRIRHEVLPLLADVADRDVVPLLARFADHARRDEAFLERLAASVDPTDAVALAASPPPVARRAVRRWLRAADPEQRPPDSAAVERVLAVARNEARATDVGAGRRVERRRQRLHVVTVGGRVAGAN